jgi:hypothetical protein
MKGSTLRNWILSKGRLLLVRVYDSYVFIRIYLLNLLTYLPNYLQKVSTTL